MFIYSLGFGLAICWLWLFYLQGPLLNPICILWGIPQETLLRWFMSAMCVTFFILFQVVKIHSLRNKKPLMIICIILLSLGPLLLGILPVISREYSNPIIANVLAAVCGAAAAFFYTAWMETIGIKSLRESSVMLGIAFAFAGGVTILGGIMHYYWILPLLILCPPISFILMLWQVPDESSLHNEYQRIDSIKLFPGKLIILIGLIYVTGGIMLNIIGIEKSYTYIFYLSYLLYALFCPIVGFILYRHEDIDLRFIYQLVIPLALMGFLLFCFQDNPTRIGAFVLLQGGSALLNMYVWLLFPYLSRFSTRPAAVCAFGQFITLFSVFSGNIIADQLSAMLSGGHNVKNMAFIACVASAATIFLFPDKKETFSGWQTLFRPEPQTFELEQQQSSPNEMKTSDSVSSLDNIPLTLREKEILILILKGRNGRFISEILNISSNTVKFHMRNIYSKLSVNNRQELLTMFENK